MTTSSEPLRDEARARPMQDAQAVIHALQLVPHPEGGWYRETWRAAASEGTRAGASVIHFLLEAGRRSHWHRVDAAEMWFWHAGAPLELEIAPAGPASAGPIVRHVLGGSVLTGQVAQMLVPTGHWQAARPLCDATADWTLVSCMVSPAFEFAGFELAPPQWSPQG